MKNIYYYSLGISNVSGPLCVYELNDELELSILQKLYLNISIGPDAVPDTHCPVPKLLVHHPQNSFSKHLSFCSLTVNVSLLYSAHGSIDSSQSLFDRNGYIV